MMAIYPTKNIPNLIYGCWTPSGTCSSFHMQMLRFYNTGELYNQSKKNASIFQETSFYGISHQIEKSILLLED